MVDGDMIPRVSKKNLEVLLPIQPDNDWRHRRAAYFKHIVRLVHRTDKERKDIEYQLVVIIMTLRTSGDYGRRLL